MYDTSTDSGFKRLLERIRSKEALIGVIGLGYVGLPLSLAYTEAGVRVLGFDVDPEKARMLLAGDSYLKHIGSERVSKTIAAGLFGST